LNDCASGLTCDVIGTTDNEHGGGYCKVTLGGDCANDDDCASGLTCGGGLCVVPAPVSTNNSFLFQSLAHRSLFSHHSSGVTVIILVIAHLVLVVIGLFAECSSMVLVLPTPIAPPV